MQTTVEKRNIAYIPYQGWATLAYVLYTVLLYEVKEKLVRIIASVSQVY